MTKITIDDLASTKLGTCKQARDYCRRNGISFDELRKHGIDVERVRHIKDQKSDIERLIEAAEEREAREAKDDGR